MIQRRAIVARHAIVRRTRLGLVTQRRQRRRWTASIAAAIGLVAIAAHAEQTQGATPSPQLLRGRGVFYLDGQVRCPLAGVGSRGAQACNRIALDDSDSTARVHAAARRIVFAHPQRTAQTQIVGDLLILAEATTRSGETTPVGVHLKIEKRGDRFSTSVHPHPTTREPIVSAVFEPFTVSVADETGERVVLTPEDTLRAIREPELTARLANLFVQFDDKLENVPLDPLAPDARLVEFDIGVGFKPISLNVARVELRSLDAANAPLITAGAIPEMLAHGAWELRITSLTQFLPREEFDRDFFLLGLDKLPALQPLLRDGLKKGQSLVVGYRHGQGFIGVGSATAPIAAAADVARDYMEFNFVGGLLARQLRHAAQRLPPSPPAPGARPDQP